MATFVPLLCPAGLAPVLGALAAAGATLHRPPKECLVRKPLLRPSGRPLRPIAADGRLLPMQTPSVA